MAIGAIVQLAITFLLMSQWTEAFHFTPAQANLAKLGSWSRRNQLDSRLLKCLQKSKLMDCQNDIVKVLISRSRNRKREPPFQLGNDPWEAETRDTHPPEGVSLPWAFGQIARALPYRADGYQDHRQFLDEDAEVLNLMMDPDSNDGTTMAGIHRVGPRRPGVRLTKRSHANMSNY